MAFQWAGQWAVSMSYEEMEVCWISRTNSYENSATVRALTGLNSSFLKYTLCFTIIWDVQKSCKNTKVSPQFPPLSTWHYYGMSATTKKPTLVRELPKTLYFIRILLISPLKSFCYARLPSKSPHYYQSALSPEPLLVCGSFFNFPCFS